MPSKERSQIQFLQISNQGLNLGSGQLNFLDAWFIYSNNRKKLKDYKKDKTEDLVSTYFI